MQIISILAFIHYPLFPHPGLRLSSGMTRTGLGKQNTKWACTLQLDTHKMRCRLCCKWLSLETILDCAFLSTSVKCGLTALSVKNNESSPAWKKTCCGWYFMLEYISISHAKPRWILVLMAFSGVVNVFYRVWSVSYTVWIKVQI